MPSTPASTASTSSASGRPLGRPLARVRARAMPPSYGPLHLTGRGHPRSGENDDMAVTAAVLAAGAVAGDQLQPNSTPPTFRPAPVPSGSRGGAGAHLGEGRHVVGALTRAQHHGNAVRVGATTGRVGGGWCGPRRVTGQGLPVADSRARPVIWSSHPSGRWRPPRPSVYSGSPPERGRLSSPYGGTAVRRYIPSRRQRNDGCALRHSDRARVKLSARPERRGPVGRTSCQITQSPGRDTPA